MEKIIVSPNPIIDQVAIIGLPETKRVSLHIYNALGKVVRQFDHSPSQVDLQALPKGVYLFQWSSPKGQITRKVIKE